jgi:hypothetical protein
MKQAVPVEPALSRSLSLTQATAINMIDMVGIGPFVVLSTIVSLMNGPWSIAPGCWEPFWLMQMAASGRSWGRNGRRQADLCYF